MLIAFTGIALAAVLLEMIGISFVLPVSECDLSLTSRDKGVLSGIGFVGKTGEEEDGEDGIIIFNKNIFQALSSLPFYGDIWQILEAEKWL